VVSALSWFRLGFSHARLPRRRTPTRAPENRGPPRRAGHALWHRRPGLRHGSTVAAGRRVVIGATATLLVALSAVAAVHRLGAERRQDASPAAARPDGFPAGQSRDLRVPDVLDADLPAAAAAVRRAGFSAETFGSGTVTSEWPSAGTLLSPGSVVVLSAVPPRPAQPTTGTGTVRFAGPTSPATLAIHLGRAHAHFSWRVIYNGETMPTRQLSSRGCDLLELELPTLASPSALPTTTTSSTSTTSTTSTTLPPYPTSLVLEARVETVDSGGQVVSTIVSTTTVGVAQAEAGVGITVGPAPADALIPEGAATCSG